MGSKKRHHLTGTSSKTGKLLADPREQKIVRIMMDLWSKEYSLNVIAQHLNGTGIKPRRGSKWEHSTIKLIITRVTEVEEKTKKEKNK
jgi:hypothetical protein